MRAISTLLLLLSLSSILWAQPVNDDCGDAIELNLSMPPSCPNVSSVTNNFMFNNIDATAISPYPVFSGCASGSTSGPAAEVWFSFVATANQTTVDVNGLGNPNVVIYQGDNCISLLALDCNSGTGTVNVAANTLIGLTYYVLVSGADIDDQGTFGLRIISNNLCNSCAPPGAFEIVPSPPPINGTYSSGQTVQFCTTVSIWEGNAAGTIEWIHAVTFEFGDGWNESSISAITPDACGNDGSWAWYDSWTSCNTGQTFGPGFAYDSASGVGCGGSPNDGNPGNNWGDGTGNCSEIPANNFSEFEFCFNIDVDDCPPSGTGDDLGIAVAIWSDGDSGSWTQTGCNSGQELEIVSSIICCNDDDPLVTVFEATCAGIADGYMEIEGNGGFDPSEVFNFYVFNASGSIVFECLSCSGTVITDANLPAGTYSVTAINVGTDCPRSAGPFDLMEPDEPQAMAIALNLPCPGGTATLEGSVDLGGGTEIYTWEGPDGTIYNGQTVSVPDAGTYILNVLVDGCPSSETTIDVDFVDFSVFIIGDEEVCFDTDFDLEASDGISWEWRNQSNNALLGTDQTLTTSLTVNTTIELTATDINGCTATATIDMNVNDLPDVSIDVSGIGCSNEELVITAEGAGPNATYEWLDAPGEPNPRFLNNYAPGFYNMEVLATDENGCQTIFTREIVINPPPDVTLEVSQNPVCAGEMVTVTAVSNDPISSINWNGAGPNNQNPITIQIDDYTEIFADVTNTDGCTTSDVYVDINVEQPQSPPTISCGINTSTSVEFVWTDVAGADEYEITIDGGDPFTVFSPFYDATGFAPNTMVTITVQAIGTDLCPVALATATCSTEACPLVDLVIDPVAPICLTPNHPNFNLSFTTDSPGGTVVWSGVGVQNATTGLFSPSMAMAGSHTITLEYTIGTCTYSDMITIVINDTPSSNFTVSNSGPICTNSPINVTYSGTPSAGATYTWDFSGGTASPGTGAGPHSVSWASAGTKTITLSVTENGCTSTLSSQSVSVVTPIATPVLSCGTPTTSSVEFNWAAVTGATSYTVNTLAGPNTGTLAGTSYTVTGLMPGETVTITVTANTNNVCGPTTSSALSCSAASCPNVTINITAIPDICLTGSNPAITLQATASGGAGGGTFSWSGPEVSGNQFNPSGPAAGAGMHTIMVTYTEGNCTTTATTTVNVFNTPTANFTLAPASVCTGQDATVTYTGTATSGATYVWNFNGGVATPGTGQGPHTVRWSTGGSKTVTLSVSENGCNSGNMSQTITVAEPMAAPVINCSPNTTSIVFSWNAVMGATGYQVNVINAPAGAMTALDETARTFTVTGLMALESVEIEVIAVGNGPCGNSSATFSCEAQDCPAITVSIDPVAPICLLPNSPDIMLTTTLVGGNGNGTYTWSGDGIADMNVGLFSPTLADVGPATVTVTYREVGCTYSNNLTIQVNEIPTADFSLTDPICISGESIANYDGSAGAMATYDWIFGGGNATPGTGAGPHTISWSTAGIKTVTLSVTENNCTSEAFTQMVTVSPEMIAPTILCDVSGDSITFSWADVAGSSGYNVTVIDAPTNASPTGNDPPRSFTISGLTPGQMATIEVEAISATACPNITFQGTCALQDCPDVTVAIDDVAPICLDATATAFNLNAVLTGNTAGILSWSGTGITDTAAATFDPTVSGAGSFVVTATYTEMTCVYIDNITILVNAQPSAAFNATSPICEDGFSTITYTGGADPMATYDWNFNGGNIISGNNAGPYEISWPDAGTPTISLTVTENNCPSEPFSATVSVLDSLLAPVISCDGDNTSITFSWNNVTGATGYTVTVIDAPAGAIETPDIANRMYSFTNLTPGDMVTIQVDVQTDQVCGGVSSIQSCTALSCDDRFFGTAGYGPFCADIGVQMLSPVISGGSLIGTISWSGSGITDPMLGTFDPATATIGDNLVTLSYEENGCFYDTTYTLVVNAIPVAAFTVTDTICLTNTSTITFTGMAGATATYNWDFGTGTIVSGSGVGPYEIQWAAPGLQSISLMVSENACNSELVSETVLVQNPLQAPIISCDSDNTSITFSWNDVIDATGYTVTVISAPAGAIENEDIANRTYGFTNLTPGDEVIIQVDVQTDNICGGVSTTQNCMAQDCIPRFFGTDTYGPFCADVGVQTLNPVLSGGALTGTITWGGNGITDPAAGTFDPAIALIGENMISLVYEEDGCLYDTVYTVIVNAIPVADFTVDSPICVTSSSTVTFTGTAGPTAIYSWDFGSGTVLSGTGAGPYEIEWSTAGLQTISLSITEEGCSSNFATQMVDVQAVIPPVVITCLQGSTSSVNFSWAPVAGADTYTVVVIDGPEGLQTGNTYSVTGLSSGQVVTIEVTASGSSICGSSVATGSCEAVECQDLTASLTGPVVICEGESASLTLDYVGGQGNSFTVDYIVDGQAFQLTGVNGPTTITLDNITETSVVTITQLTDELNANCVYPAMAEWTIMVDQPVNAGADIALDPFCADDASTVDLNAVLQGEDTGGVWTETSAIPSTGNAFNTTTGNFNAIGQLPGIYTFTYTVNGGACPEASSMVTVTILPEPTADAGTDQTLTCNMGMVTIGGNSSSTPGTIYAWTVNNEEIMITNPGAPLIDVSAAGTYTLTVTNAEGCTDTDQVVVDAELDVPVGDVSISEVSCFQANDGAIVINDVSGGTPPYLYTLNDGPATSNPFFGQLGGAEYTLTITDANGCFTELSIMMIEPTEVAVQLTATTLEGEDGNLINLGESVTLTALYDPSILVDTIIWQPDSIAIGNQQAVEVSPTETSTYTVTVMDINGCADSDMMTVFVRKDRPIFVPTAFAPTGSGENAILYPFGGDDVREIKSFLVFNRWGESVFENYSFLPNDPTQGWDGRHRGQLMNAAVFVYYLEVEYTDGEVILFKGDVMLMR